MAEPPGLLNRFLNAAAFVGNARGPAYVYETGTVHALDARRPSAPHQHQGPVTNAARHLIMVIDDEVTVLQAFNILLDAWGYDVLAAESEDEAVDKLKEQEGTPHLIVADYRLREGRTGLQAIQRLRSMVGHEVPSIIITGDTSTENLNEARACGLTVLQKPVLPPHLHAVLTQTLQSGTA
jgi:two-component system OmpR family response regulator